MNPDFPHSGRLRHLFALLACLPALGFGIAALYGNHFALIDDGVTLLGAKDPVRSYFHIGESGRFFPAFWIYHKILLGVLPAAPWSLTLGNAACFLLIALLAYHLAARLGGVWGGVLAAWLMTLNLSAAEGLFTLSKSEPKQWALWLAALFLLARLILPGRRVSPGWIAAGLVASGAACALWKETGELFALPILLFLIHALWKRAALPPGQARERIWVCLLALIPLLLIPVPVLLHSLNSSSYVRAHVMQGQQSLHPHFAAVFGLDGALTLLLVTGVLAALGGSWLFTGPERLFYRLAGIQYLALLGFFMLLPVVHPYYLLPVAGSAALLAGPLLSRLAARWRACRLPVALLAALLLAWNGRQMVLGASALSGWSWLYGELTETVVTDRPERVFFYQSGAPEVHVEARLFWQIHRGLPVNVGVLAGDPASPGLITAGFRDLRPGDWIVEEIGAEANRRIPFRDVNIARGEAAALLDNRGVGPVPAHIHKRLIARFPAFAPPFSRAARERSFLEWRIYRVDRKPGLSLEGLSPDRWMSKTAVLWLHGMPAGPVRLKLRALAPPGAHPDNRLEMRYAGATLLNCPVTGPEAVCSLTPERLSAAGVPADWYAIDLVAAYTDSPQALGFGADTRQLSFTFDPPLEPVPSAPIP